MAETLESLRWRLRGGGSRIFRWGLRAVIAVVIVCVLLIPYHHHVAGSCRIVPGRQLGVRAQLADQIIEIHRSSGEWVEAGDVVATLAARQERAAVQVAQAELLQAEAYLDLLRSGPEPEVLSIARQRVSQSELRSNYLNAEWERVQDLYQNQAAALADVQRAQQLRDSAANDLLSAKDSLTRLEKGARPQEIDSAEAEITRIQAQLHALEETLQLAEVRAPMAGQLVTEHLEARRELNVLPGDLIAEIQDPNGLRAEVAADEAAVIHVRPGMEVIIRLRGLNGRRVTGRVTSIAPTVDPESEVWRSPIRSDRETQFLQAVRPDRARVLVNVELDDPPPDLVAGMTGEAKISVAANPLGLSLLRPVVRFFRVEVWSWLP